MIRDAASRRRLLARSAGVAGGLAALALSGCGDDEPKAFIPKAADASPTPDDPNPVTGGILRTFGGPVGTVLDIHKAKSTAEALLWQWTGNFLMRNAAVAPFLPEPDLAVSQPEIPGDGTLLTFKLRPEAKWQDRPPVNSRPSRTVTAEDVKFTFDRIRALGSKSPRAGNYIGVDSIVVVAPDTLQFKLKAPQADFTAILADQFDIVIPKEIAVRGDDAITKPEDVIGSGPYELSSFDPGRRLQMRRRGDGYWRPNTAFLDGWDLTTVSDDALKANALFGGKVDHAEVPPNIARLFDQDQNFRVVRQIIAARECMELNQTVGPLRDGRVRVAIARAIDRPGLYPAVYEGAGVTGGPMTPAAAGWALSTAEFATIPGFGDRDTELTEAAKLMSAAGFPNGFDETLITVDNGKLPALAEVIVKNLGEAGIRLKPVTISTDFAVIQDRMRRGDFSFALTVFLAGMYPDAQLYLYHHTRSGLANYGKYGSVALDAMLDKQRTVYSYAARLPLVQDIQRFIVREPGPIWLGSRIAAAAVTAKVHNMGITPFSSGYDVAENVWLRG